MPGVCALDGGERTRAADRPRARREDVARPSAENYSATPVGSICNPLRPSPESSAVARKPRHSVAERATLTRAQADAWRDLHRQLARTRTLPDAKRVAARAAPPHAPRFYARLRSFVRTLQPPRHGTRSERYVYRKLRLRFAPRSPRRSRR